MQFSPIGLDFLAENMFRDDKQWYQEHKDIYKRHIIEPLSELIKSLAPTIESIDADMLCNPKRISRLYRDARYSKGKSIFRDTVWFSFNHGGELFEGAPSYFVEISPRGFSYGCGYYCASKESISAIRSMVLDNDSAYLAAQKAFDRLKGCTLYGDMYKRNHFPNESEEKCNWLNRKDMYLMYQSKDFELLFSDRLADKIKEDFIAIAPIYHFFMKAESRAIEMRRLSNQQGD